MSKDDKSGTDRGKKLKWAIIFCTPIVVCVIVLVPSVWFQSDAVAAAWATALATTATLVTAIGAGLIAWQTYEKDKKIAHARDEQEKRSQAELVMGWLPDIDEGYVRVANASNRPIYAVRGWLHPRDRNERPIKSGWIEVLPARVAAPCGRGWYIDGPAWEEIDRWLCDRQEAGRPVPEIPVELTYRDVDGQWWRRTHKGYLQEISVEYRKIPEGYEDEDPDDEKRQRMDRDDINESS